jgi:signal peptidase I
MNATDLLLAMHYKQNTLRYSPMGKRRGKKWILIFSGAAAGCILIILMPLFVRTYIIQAYKISADSMRLTLLIGDHILVDKLFQNSDSVKRGDIIVFIFPPDPRKDFVKRVIGLPNDLIEIRDKALYVNENLIQEDYVIHIDTNIFPAKIRPRDNLGPIRVPPDSLFVLGDNRDASFDSRYWGFVDLSKVKGKVTKIYWSWDSKNFQVRWDRIGQVVH